MDAAHPARIFALSTFAAVSEWSNQAHVRIMAETFNFATQPLYLTVLPVSVACLVFCVLWKRVCSHAPEVVASRTITISEVDDLMMKHSCGCDCGQVTSISNVAVAPSPELAFEPSQQPQLMLDSCASVRFFPWRLRMIALQRFFSLKYNTSCYLDIYLCSWSHSLSLLVTCESFWRKAIPSCKGLPQAPFARAYYSILLHRSASPQLGLASLIRFCLQICARVTEEQLGVVHRPGCN
jgi:hypothetical protein